MMRETEAKKERSIQRTTERRNKKKERKRKKFKVRKRIKGRDWTERHKVNGEKKKWRIKWRNRNKVGRREAKNLVFRKRTDLKLNVLLEQSLEPKLSNGTFKMGVKWFIMASNVILV